MSLSVKCTPPTLVSFTSSPSPLSVKHCSMSVNQSVQELEFYRLIGTLVAGCPSNLHPQLWCQSGPLYHLCLYTLFRECASIHSRVRILRHNQ